MFYYEQCHVFWNADIYLYFIFFVFFDSLPSIADIPFRLFRAFLFVVLRETSDKIIVLEIIRILSMKMYSVYC